MLMAAPNIQICAGHARTSIEAISAPAAWRAFSLTLPVTQRDAIHGLSRCRASTDRCMSALIAATEPTCARWHRSPKPLGLARAVCGRCGRMGSRAQATRSMARPGSAAPSYWRAGQRPATGQVLHGLLDTDDVPLDVLQVQPPSDNLTARDLEQRHPAHLKGLPVAAGARPAPFGPDRLTVPGRPADLGAEVGDPREHGLPVGEHLGPPGEGPARVRRLLAAVVLVDETGHGIKITCVYGRGQPVNHLGHQALPPAHRPWRPRASPWAPPSRRHSQHLTAAPWHTPPAQATPPTVTCGPAGTGQPRPASTSTCPPCMISRAASAASVHA